MQRIWMGLVALSVAGFSRADTVFTFDDALAPVGIIGTVLYSNDGADGLQVELEVENPSENQFPGRFDGCLEIQNQCIGAGGFLALLDYLGPDHLPPVTPQRWEIFGDSLISIASLYDYPPESLPSTELGSWWVISYPPNTLGTINGDLLVINEPEPSTLLLLATALGLALLVAGTRPREEYRDTRLNTGTW